MWKTVVTPTILVSLTWIAVSSTTTYYIHSLSEWHARVLAHNVASIRAATVMQEALWKMHAAYRETFHDRDAIHLEQMSDFEDQFIQALQSAESTSTTPEETPIVTAIRERFTKYRDVVRPRAEGRVARVPSGPGSSVRSTTLARQVADSCRELLEVNEKLMTESFAERTRMERAWTAVRVGFLIGGPAVGIVLGLWIARGLRRSISRISVTLNDASGELDQEIGSVDVSSGGASGELSELNRQVQTISTRIRRAVAELQRARHQEVRSERLIVVGELAAGLAHELRNPLTAVKLLIQTSARKTPGHPLDEKQVQIVLQEISRMESTIQGLLDFARPPKLHRVRHDLRDTIRRAANLVEVRATSENVRLLTKLPLEPLTVEGDAEQLHQVFVNLLMNGIESMPCGGEIQIEAGLCQPDVSGCRVVFSDAGEGIPAESLERIFDPFVTTKERGTGLGLAISRRIVKKHGGRISAANLPERGSAFTVELPLAGVPSLGDGNNPPSDSETEIYINPGALSCEVGHA